MTKLEKRRVKYIDVMGKYRTELVNEIRELLRKMPSTEVKLFDPDSEIGLGGFAYTDIMVSIDWNGYGYIYNNTDCIQKAYEQKQSIFDMCDVPQLEKIYNQLVK